jgi:3D-(3,5/4)-trihydroxycyclohexane-1,2-dione acylhydrolase (decyclizing)
MSEPFSPERTETERRTVAQAVVRFLAQQYTERDGERQRLFAGCFGIFGHGNVAGLGQALLQAEVDDPTLLPYVLGRNEQAMVHTATAYARAKDRLQTWAVSTSVGPGATNMVTGAALARSTGCRCCCCPPTPSPPAPRARCCRSWSGPTAATSP